jgi:lactoylglutathione lyase
VAKIIHAMIRVLELNRSLEFYRDAFGLEVSQKLDFPDFALVYLRNPENDFEIELTLNKGRTEAYTHGTGYGHVAVCVDDLEAEHARIAAAGYQPKDIKTMTHDGKPFGKFFFIEDPDGYKIEVLQKGGRFQ